ncbi:MAG: hypothetical protein JW953_13305 [Anaerolineae bacterium]|nr:hypothetical protein [Anaerolineae bacterium]
MSTSSQNADARSYNTKSIRELLNVSFTAEELRYLCYDEFRAVYMKLSEGMSKETVIHHLIEYCDIQGQMEKLLALVQNKAPGKYAEFADRLEQAVPAKSGQAEATTVKRLQELIAVETRRLHALQLRAARMGISTPPEVTLEIEDLEAKIAQLQQQLKT